MSEHIDVIVGVLRRARGVNGEVAVELRTDEPERRFRVGAQVFVDGHSDALTVAATRWVNGRLFVRFDELPDRTAVEAARGWVLKARISCDEKPTGLDEYYDRQIVGLSVLDQAGIKVGQVIDVQHLPAQDLLVIKTDTSERLVPFVAALVLNVDLASGALTLAPVGGLLEDLD